MDLGEELLPIMLEYEDLGYHYSICNKLSHLAKSCPLAPRTTQDTTLAARKEKFDVQPNWAKTYPKAPTTGPHGDFKSRSDRHGKLFGDRLPLPEV